jgi:hypothetical protein
MTLEEMTLDVEHHVELQAPIGEVFKGVLHRFGEGSRNPGGQPMPMVLEAWPGGRWFRDLGNGAGHLWGHVQSIKAPQLLELSGPLFMSYPAINHVEIKLSEVAGGTRLSLRHRSVGLLDAMHRQHVGAGWKLYLDDIQKDVQGAAA